MMNFMACTCTCTCAKCGKVFRSDWEEDTFCDQCLDSFFEEVEEVFEEEVIREISIEFSCNQ